MTQEQLDNVVEESKFQNKQNPRWRPGQAFFNTLMMLHPEEAEKIRATVYDPFHVDKNINKAINFLKD